MSQKTHIVIVVGMLCLMYLAYSLVARWQNYDQPTEVTQTTLVDETIYIQFDRATFGENCNNRIMDMSVAQKLGVENQSSKGGYRRFTIEDNNAIEAVKKFCGTTKQCTIEVNENALGFDPAPRCDKNLRVSYRCFNFDIRREAEAPYNGEVVIDCNNVSTK